MSFDEIVIITVQPPGYVVNLKEIEEYIIYISTDQNYFFHYVTIKEHLEKIEPYLKKLRKSGELDYLDIKIGRE